MTEVRVPPSGTHFQGCLGIRQTLSDDSSQRELVGQLGPVTSSIARPWKVYYTCWVHFVWDPKKAASNAGKHGVSFSEAVTVFEDPLALVVEDDLYADRAIIVGQSEKLRILVTVFVELSEDTTRIISARRATSHERRRYEEGSW